MPKKSCFYIENDFPPVKSILASKYLNFPMRHIYKLTLSQIIEKKKQFLEHHKRGI